MLNLVSPRFDIINAVVRMLAEPGFPVAVLSGSSGVGKSTIVRSLVPAELAHDDRVIVNFTGSPSLGAQQVGTDVAIALGLTDQRYTRRYGGSAPIQQSVDEISESRKVHLNQAATSVTVEGQLQDDASDLTAWLNSLALSTERDILVVIDQVEQLYVQDARLSAVSLLEQLLRAAVISNGHVALVLAVRDRYIHEIIHLAANFPGLVNRIVPVHGLQVSDAQSFIESSLEWYGARFSKSLYNRLIARLQGQDGRIWPVALHACCRPLVEIAYAKNRAASVKDLENLGDLSGILARAVNDELAALNSDGTGDALFILSLVASSYQNGGPISIDDLAREMPSYPLTDLGPILNALVGLKLLEQDRSGCYRPSHDSLGGAVAMLRSPGGSATLIQRLDEAVARWSRSGKVGDVSDLPTAELLQATSQPTPHLTFLAAAFLHRAPDIETVALLRSRLGRVSPRHLIRVVWAQARRQGRLRSLGPEGVFTLALTGHADCAASALEGMRLAALGNDTNWLPSGFQSALDSSGFQFDVEILRRCELNKWPAAATRVVMRACIRQAQLLLPRDFLTELWASFSPVLRCDLLQLAALHAPNEARELVDQAIRSDLDYLRAAAVEASCLAEVDGAAEIVLAATADDSTMVRRRATYMLPKISSDLAITALGDLALNDSSSFVREAAVECIAELKFPEFESIVLRALTDSSGIVRESAVYAVRHVLGSERAADPVRPLIQDDSPHVREAALRVLSIANQPASAELILAELRAESESQRTAALGALMMADPEFIAPIIADVLTSWSSKSTIIGALRLVAAVRLEAAISGVARIVSEIDDAEILCEVSLTLQALKGDSASELLCSLAFHPSADVRERAVYALAEVGGPNATNVLTSCLYDPSTSIQTRAIYGLARLRSPAADNIIRTMNRSRPEIADAINYYEREIGDVDDR